MGSKTTPTYSDEQWTSMLTAGGRREDVNNIHGAVHLLTYTDLPGRRQFAEHVRIELAQLYGPNGDPEDGKTLTAVVRNWKVLPDIAADLQMGSSTVRLLTLAAGLATGIPVDVRDCLTGFGRVTASRAAEAVLIATGYAQWYTTAEQDQ